MPKIRAVEPSKGGLLTTLVARLRAGMAKLLRRLGVVNPESAATTSLDSLDGAAELVLAQSMLGAALGDTGRASGGRSPRARLEPALDAWIGRLLGPLPALGCSIRYRIPGSDAAQPAPYAVRLDQLGLEPIDIVFAFDEAFSGDLAARLDRITHLRFRADYPAAEILEIAPELYTSGASDRRPIGLLLPLLDRLRDILSGARPVPHHDPPAANTIDVSELLARVRELAIAFDATRSDIEGAANTDRAAMETALMAAAQFVGNVVPRGDASPESLVRSVRSAAAQMCARRTVVLDLWPNVLPPAPLTAPAGDTLSLMQATVAALFGHDFSLIPRLAPTNEQQ